MECPPISRAGLFLPRSAYSLLRGPQKVADLVTYAQKAGFSALGLADRGNLYALPELISCCRKAGVKSLACASLPGADGGGELCLILALERGGFSRLCALLSRRFEAIDPYRQPPSPGAFEAGDVLASLESSGCGGLAFLTEDISFARALRERGAEVYVQLRWGKDFYGLVRRARAAGLPLVAVSRPVCFDALDDYRYRLLRSIDLRLTLGEFDSGLAAGALPGEDPFEPSWRPCLASDMQSLFSALPEALDNASALAERARDSGSFLSPVPVFPSYLAADDAPPGIAGRTLGAAEAEAYLESLCREGIGARYGEQGYARSDVALRLERELAMIGGKGFAPYFLTVRDIVRTCPRTCGRGSAASSIVSYLLGLTHVDPLEHDLYFERFLNAGRSDPPDIDIDFPWDERAAVLEGVFKRYPGRSGMVADHCGFRRRGALREVGLAFGASEAELAAWALLKDTGRWRDIPEAPRRSAELIAGLPRYVGLHPGGVVVVPGPITDYVHVQPSLAGYPLIAWEKEGTEASGLVKIDVLGNRSLAVLRDCIELCRPLLPGDRKIEWGDFSVVGDGRTRRMIESGDTLGVFYVESPATRALLKKMGNGDYGHLVVASSIIRPAANRWIGEYVRRLKGGEWDRLPEEVEETLRETHGVMVYQEDVSKVAEAAAGFDAVQADRLRKALTKKDRLVRIPAFRDLFYSGCAARGRKEADIDRMWDMMLSFDGYSFCKAHSASYALVSYKLAYLKARCPLEFLCCVINNSGGFYPRQVYLNDARRLGFPILPPSVNSSGVPYRVEAVAAAVSGAGKGLRVGLSQVKGLSAGLARRIVLEREARGPFPSLEDFARRCAPASDEARALALSGALDGLSSFSSSSGPAARPRLLWAWEALRGEAARGLGGPELFPRPEPPCPAGDYRPSEKLLDEAVSLGVIASGHPARLFSQRARRAAASRGLPEPIDSRLLGKRAGRAVAISGTRTAAKEVLTSSGEPMAFLSLEDEYGAFETVLFPQAYARLMPILEENGAFLVVGRVQDDSGSLSIEVRDLIGLSRPAARR